MSDVVARPKTWQEKTDLKEKPTGRLLRLTDLAESGLSWLRPLLTLGVHILPLVGPLLDAVEAYQKGEWVWFCLHLAFVVVDTFFLGAVARALVSNVLEMGIKKLGQETLKQSPRMLAKKIPLLNQLKRGVQRYPPAQAKLLNRRIGAVISTLAKECEEAAVKTAFEPIIHLLETVRLGVNTCITAVSANIYGDASFQNMQAESYAYLPLKPREVLTDEQCRGTVYLSSDFIPRDSLHQSNYLVLYNRYQREVRSTEVLRPLRRISKTAQLFQRCLDGTIHPDWEPCDVYHAAARFWSLEEWKAYTAINAAIRTDNPHLLRMWMPFIRALNNMLLRYTVVEAAVVRRNSGMSREDALSLENGTTYRMAQYTAASRLPWDKMNKVGATSAPKVRWVFEVPANCFQASDISKSSFFGSSEEEVLLVPYTPVTITRKDVTSDLVEIHATLPVDGLQMPLELPTCLA